MYFGKTFKLGNCFHGVMKRITIFTLAVLLATFIQIGLGDMMARLGWVLMPYHIVVGFTILALVALIIATSKYLTALRTISFLMLFLLILQIAMGFDMFFRGVTESIELAHQLLAYVIFVASLITLGIGYKAWF